MALELHGAQVGSGSLRRAARWLSGVVLLASACVRGPDAPKTEGAAAAGAEDPAVEASTADGPGPTAPGSAQAVVQWEAAAACAKGLEVPAVDPSLAEPWNARTRAQQEAVFRSPAHDHWSRTASRGPIMIVDGDTLRLQSVDGCWSQELPPVAHADQTSMDGPGGLLWMLGRDRLVVLDLVNAPSVPVTIIEHAGRAEFRIDYAALRPVQTLGEPTLPAVRLTWGRPPSAVAQSFDGGAPESVSLTEPGVAWLMARTEGLPPGARRSDVPLEAVAADSGLTPVPTCKFRDRCGYAQPLGSFGLHRVVVGDLVARGDAIDGPACVLWDVSAEVWRRDVDGEPLAPGADLLEAAEPCEDYWLVDPSGRAVSMGGRVCTAVGCRESGGTVLGFVRGDVALPG